MTTRGPRVRIEALHQPIRRIVPGYGHHLFQPALRLRIDRLLLVAEERRQNADFVDRGCRERDIGVSGNIVTVKDREMDALACPQVLQVEIHQAIKPGHLNILLEQDFKRIHRRPWLGFDQRWASSPHAGQR